MPYIREYSALNAQERRQLGYKRAYKSDVPAWDDSMILLRDLVARKMPERSRVLDIGCGHHNFVIDELAGRWGERVGFDLAEEAAAGNTSVDRVVIGSGGTLPFPDNSFDVALSLWVLEHAALPEHLFREIHRVLKPNGFFGFVTPNRHFLLIPLRRLLPKRFVNEALERWYGRKEENVFNVYYRANTVRDLQSLAAAANLAPEVLIENPDPSYTSFGPVSYWISKTVSAWPWSWTKTHLIGVFRKPSTAVSRSS